MAVGDTDRRVHLLFMALFGVMGWAVLLAATYFPELAPEGSLGRGTPLVPFSIFFLIIVGTRGLAFRILPETVLSLDAAFYIASAVCLGSVVAGRLVALALTLDALIRFGRFDAQAKRAGGHLAEYVTFALYFGGLSGGLLFGTAWLFQVDARALIGRAAERETLLLVFGLGLSFLVLHYLIQGARMVLGGQSWRQYLARMAIPGMVAEASLLPLSVVVVLLYDPERPLALALLGATYLLVNFVFNRLSLAEASLRKRVGELETLNRTAHALGSTLQLPELIESLARETLSSVPEAQVLAFAHKDKEQFVVDYYDRTRGDFQRVRTQGALPAGGSAWVVEHKRTLRVADLAREELGASDSGMRSWLGVPIVVYDEVIGVLSVQSRERGVFREEHERLVEAIGAQAAVAIQNVRLYELATVDGLTGVHVRRYFDARLREELERARRFKSEFSLILLDIDDFKRLNDTHGHPLGDRVLREVAQVARRNMRGIDITARYGGEEFALILPRTGIVDAHAVAERIRQDVADTQVAVDDKTFRVTVSLGVACYPESGEGSAEDLVERADVALYRAKATGKNRVELYWGERDSSAPRRLRPV